MKIYTNYRDAASYLPKGRVVVFCSKTMYFTTVRIDDDGVIYDEDGKTMDTGRFEVVTSQPQGFLEARESVYMLGGLYEFDDCNSKTALGYLQEYKMGRWWDTNGKAWPSCEEVSEEDEEGVDPARIGTIRPRAIIPKVGHHYLVNIRADYTGSFAHTWTEDDNFFGPYIVLCKLEIDWDS